MTNTTDYTQLPEVLVACGIDNYRIEGGHFWRWHGEGENSYGTFDHGPTMQELWGGLCKAWKARWIGPLDDEAEELLRKARPAIQGMDCVVLWEPGETHFYPVKEYGTLNNAIAAALHWVLQQAVKKEE